MTTQLATLANGRQQFIDANGHPIVGGTVATYTPGTLVPKSTYQDSSGMSANPNPLTLDALGSAAMWGDGLYRQIVKDASNNVIWDANTFAPSSSASLVTSVAGLTGDITAAQLSANGRLGLSDSSYLMTVGGTNFRSMSTTLEDYANVNDFLNTGDTTYDGAITRALTAEGKVYFPSKPALGGTTYDTTATITLQPGQQLLGDGSASTIIRCLTPSASVVTFGQQMTFVGMRGLQLIHKTFTATGNSHTSTLVDNLSVNPVSIGWTAGMPFYGPGVPTRTTIVSLTATSVTLSNATTSTVTGGTFTVNACTSTGHGVTMGIGNLDWVNDGFLQDVRCNTNWIGWNLGCAFSCIGIACTATGNYDTGFKMFTAGTAIGFAGTVIQAALQWVWINPAAGSNGWDGYSYGTGTTYSSGNQFAGCSVGTIYNGVTFANGHHGVAAYGTNDVPLNSIRILGGFIGQDLADGIYLDTYGRDHVVNPDFTELAGQYNIEITINNANVNIQVKQCGGANWDGLTSSADNLIVTGGNFVNNGRAGVGVDNFAGIHIVAGTATISGTTSRNFNSSIQQYGIRTAVDGLLVTGCHLDPPGTFGSTGATINGSLLSAANMGNILAPIGGIPLVNSSITGCFPSSINNATNLPANVHITGTLQVDKSIGVGTTPSAGVGDIAMTTLHASGATAFAGGINVSGVGISILAGAGQLIADNATLRTGLGVGVSSTNTIGRIDAATSVFTGGVQANNLGIGIAASGTSGQINLTGNLVGSGATGWSINGATGNAYFGGSIGVGPWSPSGTAGDMNMETLHTHGAAAFIGDGSSLGITVQKGGLSFTTGIVGNGITVDNIAIRNSLGVGTSANGAVGRIDSTGLFSVNDGSGHLMSFNPTAASGNLLVTGNMSVGTNGVSVTGSGKITVSTSLDLNGTLYTNP